MDFHIANEMGSVAVEFPWSPSIGTWLPSSIASHEPRFCSTLIVILIPAGRQATAALASAAGPRTC